jgi:hypothetical protein
MQGDYNFGKVGRGIYVTVWSAAEAFEIRKMVADYPATAAHFASSRDVSLSARE